MFYFDYSMLRLPGQSRIHAAHPANWPCFNSPNCNTVQQISPSNLCPEPVEGHVQNVLHAAEQYGDQSYDLPTVVTRSCSQLYT